MTKFTGLNGPLPTSKPEGESKPLVDVPLSHESERIEPHIDLC